MRLIDADALEKELSKRWDISDDQDFCNKEVWEALRNAPTIEAEQRWIPCSDRLPKKGEVVLITNGKGNVRCGQYRSEHDVRSETHYWWWKGKTVESVLAWMPLPTPYKGGDTE